MFRTIATVVVVVSFGNLSYQGSAEQIQKVCSEAKFEPGITTNSNEDHNDVDDGWEAAIDVFWLSSGFLCCRVALPVWCWFRSLSNKVLGAQVT